LEALQEVNNEMLILPEKPASNILAGKIYKHLNQADLSQREFEKALSKNREKFLKAEFDWQKVAALKSMGEVYTELGNNVLALEHLRKALEYAHEGKAKMDIRNLIKKINTDQER